MVADKRGTFKMYLNTYISGEKEEQRQAKSLKLSYETRLKSSEPPAGAIQPVCAAATVGYSEQLYAEDLQLCSPPAADRSTTLYYQGPFLKIVEVKSIFTHLALGVRDTQWTLVYSSQQSRHCEAVAAHSLGGTL